MEDLCLMGRVVSLHLSRRNMSFRNPITSFMCNLLCIFWMDGMGIGSLQDLISMSFTHMYLDHGKAKKMYVDMVQMT